MEVWEWIPFLKRRRKAIALFALLTAAVTMAVTFIMPSTYSSTATLLFQPLTLDQPLGFPTATEMVARTLGELVKSPTVQRRAARQLDKAELEGTPEYRVPENTGLLLVIVTAESPELAAEEANAIAASLIAVNTEALSAGADAAQTSIDERLAGLRVRIADTEESLAAARAKPNGVAEVRELQDKLDSLNTAYEGVLQDSQLLPSSATALTTSLMISDAAVAQPEPVSPKPMLNLLLSVVGGILLGVAFARATESAAKGSETGV